MSSIPPPFDWSERLNYRWNSEEGLNKLRRQVGPSLPYQPHPFQLECTARILDGQDVLCLCATGGGKSALIYLAPIARKGTITLVVCPTNFLESDLVSGLEKKGVSALAINSETLASASIEGRDLWAEAKTGKYQVLLFGPETTGSEEFDGFINDPQARLRMAYFVVDEIHLVYQWGPDFRQFYAILSTMRARLPEWTVFVGLTATLEPGLETASVIHSVGFKPSFHFERQDCERHNVDLITREMKYPCTGYEFRDLDWLIPPDFAKASDLPKRLVYCITIELGHRLVIYLRLLLPPHLRKYGRTLIRHMHSISCPECKAEGLVALYKSGDDRDCVVFVATEILGVGIDVPDIDTIIDYPCPSSLASLVQHAGRPARGAGCHGEAIVYIKKTEVDATTSFINSDEYKEDPRRIDDLPGDDPLASDTISRVNMDVDTDAILPTTATEVQENGSEARDDPVATQSVIWFPRERAAKRSKKAASRPLVANRAGLTRTSGIKNCASLRLLMGAHVRRMCIIRQINIIYQNPGVSKDCRRCSSCTPRLTSDPRPRPSEMSASNTPAVDVDVDLTVSNNTGPAYLKPLARDLEGVARRLEVVAMELRANGPDRPDLLFIGSRSFLTSGMIKKITANFSVIDSEAALQACMDGWQYWDDYGSGLWDAVRSVQSELREMLESRHEEKLAKQRDSREKKKEEVRAQLEAEKREAEATRAQLESLGLAQVKRVKLLLPRAKPDTATSPSTITSDLRAIKTGSDNSEILATGILADTSYGNLPSKKRRRPVVEPSNQSLAKHPQTIQPRNMSGEVYEKENEASAFEKITPTLGQVIYC